MEKAILSTPLVHSSTITDYQILSVFIQRAPAKLVIIYQDNLGNELSDEHTGVDAPALVKFLNTANLSLKSLERLALEHLIAEGKIPTSSITTTTK